MNRTSLHVPPRSGSTNRSRVRSGRLLKASALGALSSAVAAAGLLLPADAAVNAGHTVFVLKDDSIVEAEGLVPETRVLVELKRNGIVVGSSEGPADPGGTYILNHDVCWDRFTPQILPGDVVEVTNNGITDRVTVADIEVLAGPSRVGDTFTIRGQVNGPRVPVGELQVEARTNDPIRFRPLAPNADAEDGPLATLEYDGPTGGAFTATFTGLDAQQQEAADNLGEFFVTHAPAANEMTMATEGSGAPGPGCPGTLSHAVTAVSRTVINRANQAKPLRVTGMTTDATNVSVRLRDRNSSVVKDVTPVGTGAQTWSVRFPASALTGLNGRVSVVGTYTVGGAEVQGATISLLKDTVAPARPTASPRAGRYRRPQSVTLNAGRNERIRYTLGNGRQRRPTATRGTLYRRQIRVATTQTLKAVAVDRAGNVSPLTQRRYRIVRRR